MWRTTKDISMEIEATWADVVENLDETAGPCAVCWPRGLERCRHAGGAAEVVRCQPMAWVTCPYLCGNCMCNAPCNGSSSNHM